MTSNQHALYALCDTRATVSDTEGIDPAKGSKFQKAGLSSDWRLQFASTKAELLVIANQHVAVNTFPGFVHTARQTMSAGNA